MEVILKNRNKKLGAVKTAEFSLYDAFAQALTKISDKNY